MTITGILKKPTEEYEFFLQMPRPMRILLVTNLIYAFVIPVIEIFVGSYIMRSTNDPSIVALYQLTVYTGIPLTFLINGFLLRYIKIAHLYSFGMLLSGLSMLVMMSLKNLSVTGVGVAGILMGCSFGFFWANRDFLALNTTKDSNRNYYYGLETFFYTNTSIIVPLLIGAFLGSVLSPTTGRHPVQRGLLLQAKACRMRNFKLYSFITVFVLTLGGKALAQGNITGSVKDATGQAVIGANVFIKGTSTGTVTDVNGQFSLQTATDNSTDSLTISFIGYQTQSVSMRSRTVFDIVLADDAKTLGEVVVTGYQAEERGKILGAVNTVSPALINRLPVAGIDQALQGRVPGVNVTASTGSPGAPPTVRIRGTGSLNSNNQPLYVIDGVPTLDAQAISPADIETLTVLKDASASAIYGSRAANGVILITTKMGTANKMQINYSVQTGVQTPVRLVPMASTSQYVSIYNEAANADNPNDPSFLRRSTISPALAATLPNVNQVKAIIHSNAPIQTHNLSISGGDSKTRYLISGSYFNQQGIITASDYKRFTGRVNLTSEVKPWLIAGMNMNFAASTQDLVGDSGDGAGGNGGSVLRYAYFRSPAIPIRDSTGNFVDKPARYDLFGDGYNPVGMLYYNNNRKTVDRIFGRFFLTLKPIEGLTITSNLGVDFTSANQRRFDTNWGTDLRINNPSRLTITSDRLHTLTFTNFANYMKKFQDHTFTFFVGTEAIMNETYEITASDSQFANQNPTLTYLGNGLALTKTVGETKQDNTLLSYYGSVKYDYQSKYLASAVFRRDGSSRFGPNNRYGNFYGGNLGWSIDKESFLTNNAWIDRLLLRAGYGVVGNQEIGNYTFSDAIGTSNNYPFGGVKNVGYATSTLGNAGVKWESSSQSNAGFDLSVLSGKLTVSLDYFHKITSDLLNSQPLALSAGLANPPTVNNGKILNRGFELAVNYTDKKGDFFWSVSPNAALLHNEVLAINSPINGGLYGSQYTTRTEKGYQVGSFFMPVMAGIFQSQDEINRSAIQGTNDPTSPTRIQPGDVKYKDISGPAGVPDGTIDANDRAHVGSAIPKVTGGLNIMVGYKNWDLSAFFQGAYGQKILSVLNRDIEGFYRAFNVTERYFKNHWTPENPSNMYPRASWDAAGNNTAISTRFLESGSYTRLKNLQIGYNVPTAFLQKYNIARLRIYFSGSNLFTWTKYSGMDPEMTVSNNSTADGDKSNGIDWGTYPAAKSYNIGLNLTF